MKSEIEQYLRNEFIEEVINSSKKSSKETLQKEIDYLINDNDKNIIEGICGRLKRGTKLDLAEFIDRNFNSNIFQLGIRARLVHTLITQIHFQFQKKLEIEYNHNNICNEDEDEDEDEKNNNILNPITYINESKTSSSYQMLINSWRLGKITPIELFSYLKNNVDLGLLDESTAKSIETQILEDAGYSKNNAKKDYENMKRLNIDSWLDIDTIQYVITSIDGLEIELHTLQGDALRIVANENLKLTNIIQENNRQPTTSNGKIWWQHCNCNDNISIIYTSYSLKEHPILLIGDILRLPNSESVINKDNKDYISSKSHLLEIDKVIGVDEYTHVSNEMITFSILIEGRIIMGGIDKSSRGYLCDGISEMGCDDFIMESNSPNSELEEESFAKKRISSMSSVKSRYYVLFITSVHDIITINSVTSIQEGIILDQIPTNILCINENLSLLSGTNGLLGYIKNNNTQMNINNNCNNNGKEIIQNDIDNFVPLIIDNYANTNDINSLNSNIKVNKSNLTHNSCSMITSLTYSRECGLIATGDNYGIISVWKVSDCINDITPIFTSLCIDCTFNNNNDVTNNNNNNNMNTAMNNDVTDNDLPINRINNIQISPSGHNITVSLFDRCLLIGVNYINQYQRNRELGTLFIRSVIDIVEGHRVVYKTTFSFNKIHIWRIMRKVNLNEENSKILNSNIFDDKSCITRWIHTNPDLDDIFSLSITTNNSSNSSNSSSLDKNMNILDDSIFCENEVSMSGYTEQDTLFSDENVITTDEDSITDIDFNNISNNSVSEMEYDLISIPPDSVIIQVYNRSSSDYDNRIKYNDINDNDDNDNELLIGQFSKSDYISNLKLMISIYIHESSDKFQRIKKILAVICACMKPPSVLFIATTLDMNVDELIEMTKLNGDLYGIMTLTSNSNANSMTSNTNAEVILIDNSDIIKPIESNKNILKWLTCTSIIRITSEFWIDISIGHNYLCSLYLKYCANKSVAIECHWQDYIKTYGCLHLRKSSRELRKLTENIRKIDETALIKDTIPRQLGYITGLQEIYARRVGLCGRIPSELGQLSQLRVLSMGNNQLCGAVPDSLGRLKYLQRIVLHQNKLTGEVPQSLGQLGCIVNLAGNIGLEYGDDVPAIERKALIDIYNSTKGNHWVTNNNWTNQNEHVSNWYKVGVLSSHVHSIVMSSNGMDGKIPISISKLAKLRMIELATMPLLGGSIPVQLCTIITLRRLCICRCGLTGNIPFAIGQLVGLEELQLFGNKLTGVIPSSISCLSNLKLLSLGEYTGGNDFDHVPLPACLSTLHNLEALFMANCNIKGLLPNWLGALVELRQLDLQRNNINGIIPNSIGRLSNLLYLNLKDNTSLSGRLPIDSLKLLTKLNRLSLVHCNFTNGNEDTEILQEQLNRCKIWI